MLLLLFLLSFVHPFSFWIFYSGPRHSTYTLAISQAYCHLELLEKMHINVCTYAKTAPSSLALPNTIIIICISHLSGSEHSHTHTHNRTEKSHRWKVCVDMYCTMHIGGKNTQCARHRHHIRNNVKRIVP